MGNHTAMRAGGRFSRALALLPRGGRSAGETSAQQWQREMKRYGRGDPRYQPEGIREAAAHPMDHAAIVASAQRSGQDPHYAELLARMNVASIASVPRTQVSNRTRAYFMASAARGEDTYAYPPISLEGPLNTPWNVWYRGQRAELTALDEAVGGVVESQQPGRLGPGNPQLGSGR